LLCDRVTGGLAPSDLHEFDRLSSQQGREFKIDEEAYERAAAALLLAEIGLGDTALPERLARQIELDSAAHLGARRSEASGRSAPGTERLSAESRDTIPMPRVATRSGLGGWLAAAAALALAVLGWWPRFFPPPASSAPVPGAGMVALTAAEARAALLREDPGVIQASWVMPAPESPDDSCTQGCAGDIVWSNAKQQGYMRFKGLARNDPSASQYQLWIFDSNQPEETPVDGGVFDVTGDGEVIVPVDAKLRVVDPKLFAVTVEKPGGVVRSERKRIPVLAKVDA